MVGNPLTYMPYRDYGMYGTFAGHNLLPKPEWDSYLKAGCRCLLHLLTTLNLDLLTLSLLQSHSHIHSLSPVLVLVVMM